MLTLHSGDRGGRMPSRLLIVGMLAIGLPTLVHAEPYLSFAVSGQGNPAISDDDFY